jgi:cobalt-zinc-cadmium efflux system membrane fusion protein
MRRRQVIAIAVIILVGAMLAWAILWTGGPFRDDDRAKPPGSQQVNGEPIRGPHGGRALAEGDFQLEVSIFERGVPPHFRVYPFEKGKPVNPDEVKLTIELHRLGGRVDVIGFRPEGEYLRGDTIVEEPHSFDVKVIAERKGRAFRWEYAQIEGRIELSPDVVRSLGIVAETAGPARLKQTLELPGEIALNPDKVGHVVPRVAGVVTDVQANLGDRVGRDGVIAVLDSRELADLRSEYVAALKRVELARATFEREETLWRKRISPEQDYLVSRQALAEAEIKAQAAMQKLLALRLSRADVERLSTEPVRALARYEIRAPFDGTVIEKHVAVGEAVKEDATIFVIADLSMVRVDVTIYARDLRAVRAGQMVTVRSDVTGSHATGRLTYVGSLVGEQTRSAKAYVLISNPDGRWRPGLFVTVHLIEEEATVPVAVRADAIQQFRDWDVVFIQVGNLFEVRPVKLGRRDRERVEVIAGLSAGDRYVSKNSYILKAELEKAGATHEH